MSMGKVVVALGAAVVGVPTLAWMATGFSNPWIAFIGEKIPPEEAGILINEYGPAEGRGIENAEFVGSGRVTYSTRTHTLVTFPITQVTHTLSDDPDVETTAKQAVNFTLGPVPIAEDITVRVLVPPEGGKNFKSFITSYGRSVPGFIQNQFANGASQCANEVTVKLELDNPLEYVEARASTFREEWMSCLSDRFPEVTLISLDVLGSPDWRSPAIVEQLESLQASKAKADKALQEKIATEAEAARNLAQVQGEVAAEEARASLLSNPLYRERLELDFRQQELDIRAKEAENWNGVRPAPTVIQSPSVQVAPGNPPQ